MPGKFLLLLVGWAALELASLYFLSVALDFWTVLYLVVLTGFMGFSALGRHGRALSQEYGAMTQDPAAFAAKTQAEPGGMEAVKSRYAERMLGMFGGILLLVPGGLSDLLGLLLFIPALRRFATRKAGKLMETLPQNPKFQDFVARQGARMPGGQGNPFGGAGMPGQSNPFAAGRPGAPFGGAPRGQSGVQGPVIDTTATDG